MGRLPNLQGSNQRHQPAPCTWNRPPLLVRGGHQHRHEPLAADQQHETMARDPAYWRAEWQAENTERTGRGALDTGAAVPANAGAQPVHHPQGVRLSSKGNRTQQASSPTGPPSGAAGAQPRHRAAEMVLLPGPQTMRPRSLHPSVETRAGPLGTQTRRAKSKTPLLKATHEGSVSARLERDTVCLLKGTWGSSRYAWHLTNMSLE